MDLDGNVHSKSLWQTPAREASNPTWIEIAQYSGIIKTVNKTLSEMI